MPELSEDAPIRSARLADMDPATLYRILRIRVDVFVVEQECAYPELDGRDLEPDTEMLWWEEDGAPLATLRILREGGDVRIGRVVTAAEARGRGLSGALMREAVARHADSVIRLDAQAHLRQWYARFGFAVTGDEFLEDGIPHVPMTREPGQAQGS